jgi:hypothetical protein
VTCVTCDEAFTLSNGPQIVREFRDSKGTEWVVFLTERRERAATRDHYLPEEYRDGWLVFESSKGEKRRLAPVPPDWESLPDDHLAALCTRATATAPRIRERPTARRDAPAERAADGGAPLRPQLREMEQRLEQALGEVCSEPAPTKLNTGELIHVEETLAIATQAAKEAVSLRRRLRADRGDVDRGESPEAPGLDQNA